MESIKEFLRVDVINGGLLISESNTVGGIEISGGLFLGFFGGSFDMRVRVDV